MTQVRVWKFLAEAALNVLPGARDCQDAAVINACVRVRQGWLLGRRVDRSDADLVQAFVA